MRRLTRARALNSLNNTSWQPAQVVVCPKVGPHVMAKHGISWPFKPISCGNWMNNGGLEAVPQLGGVPPIFGQTQPTASPCVATDALIL